MTGKPTVMFTPVSIPSTQPQINAIRDPGRELRLGEIVDGINVDDGVNNERRFR